MFVILLMGAGSAYAMRSKKPPTFTNLNDTNQLTELNQVLEDGWQIQNGRYTLENLTTNPQDVRKGTKGDLVYSTFGGNDHLCVSTSFPEGKNWTCVNVGTLATCPGGADTQVQFNDNGNCGGDVQFTWDKNSNTLLVNGVVGIGGDVTAPSADLEIDPTNVTGLTVNNSALISDNQVFWLNSGVTVPSQFQNQFLAPTINGIAGAPTETVTNASTVYIDTAPAGSNISLTNTAALWINTGDIILGNDATGQTKIKALSTPTNNTNAKIITIETNDGLGSGRGGTIELDAGDSALSGGTGEGGLILISAGQGGGTSGDAGYISLVSGDARTLGIGGDIYIQSGRGFSSGATRRGGDILIQTERGSASGGRPGTVFIENRVAQTGLAEEATILQASTAALGLASGTTLAANRSYWFDAPTLNGVAGGATETVTSAATLYIEAAPSGSNITFTNGPYAFWSDAGRNRLDGFVDMFASATVTGILTVDGSTITNDINTGFGAVELAAGVWTPTANSIANLDASSAAEGQYLRVGATVSFSLQITVDPTAPATSTQLELDLPVASNFGAVTDAAGTCFAPGIASQGAAVLADATADELEIRFISADLTSQTMYCSGSYEVI